MIELSEISQVDDDVDDALAIINNVEDSSGDFQVRMLRAAGRILATRVRELEVLLRHAVRLRNEEAVDDDE